MSIQINTAYKYSNMTTNDNDNILFKPYNTLHYTWSFMLLYIKHDKFT